MPPAQHYDKKIETMQHHFYRKDEVICFKKGNEAAVAAANFIVWVKTPLEKRKKNNEAFKISAGLIHTQSKKDHEIKERRYSLYSKHDEMPVIMTNTCRVLLVIYCQYSALIIIMITFCRNSSSVKNVFLLPFCSSTDIIIIISNFPQCLVQQFLCIPLMISSFRPSAAIVSFPIMEHLVFLLVIFVILNRIDGGV